jgi:hypothetical protein
MQNYFCRRKEVGETPITPSASHLEDRLEQIIVHYLTINQNQEEKTNETHTKRA